MKHIALAMLISLSMQFAFAQDTTQQIVQGRANSKEQEAKPYVIMISIDGFRYDYAEKYQAKNLLKLSGEGVKATAMQPSYPSLTFPNHYTLVTGLYPAHHGLVDNSFYDRNRKQSYDMKNRDAVQDGTWYGGTPIWVLAEKQHMVSASYFWVGSESPIQNIRPTYSYRYQEKTGIDSRIQSVVNWLKLPEAQRPHLITFYFPEVDHAGHNYGPESAQVKEQVQFVDESIGKMVKAVSALNLPVNYIIVADHGMAAVDTVNLIQLKDLGLRISWGGEKVMLYSDDTTQVNVAYAYYKSHEEHFRAYRKNEMPARWHYGTEDKYNRIGDIVLVPDPYYIFAQPTIKKQHAGHHGFDNNLTDMNAVFMAWGPAFKAHQRIGTFANIHVYPLVAEILGLKIEAPVDGQLEILQPILKRK